MDKDINMSLREDQEEERPNIRDSFITEAQPNICLRFLKKIDIFSFIPVPKDDSVSTKQSLIGTAVFFTIFLTYIIYDFVKFVDRNPPIQQSYRSQLDSGVYSLPNFAIAFMSGNLTDETQPYDELFTYDWKSITKRQGKEDPVTLDMTMVKYENNQKINFDRLPWMSDSTKQFYYILRTPTSPLTAQGLLYASDVNSYVRVKISYCKNVSMEEEYMADFDEAGFNVEASGCLPKDNMTYLSNYGRFFLFVENKPDDSTISEEKPSTNGNNYLLYNFFAVPGFYKRININFQVIKTTILPDYFLRWSDEETVRLQVESIFEEVSVVNYVPTNTDAIAFNFQLSPLIVNNRVAFATLLDHISLWGAFWGVLFAVFALFFLSYNRRKFYKKNPQWSKFKKLGNSSENIE